jgi:hypothetical protein
MLMFMHRFLPEKYEDRLDFGNTPEKTLRNDSNISSMVVEAFAATRITSMASIPTGFSGPQSSR